MRWETNLGNGITNVQASDLCAVFTRPPGGRRQVVFDDDDALGSR